MPSPLRTPTRGEAAVEPEPPTTPRHLQRRQACALALQPRCACAPLGIAPAESTSKNWTCSRWCGRRETRSGSSRHQWWRLSPAMRLHALFTEEADRKAQLTNKSCLYNDGAS
ncbi:hypothetical protein BS78_K273300 [Paspalum vaginatum]|uniref:Uncharacterized protein n=1 Tax=Paspalum vaginatum TaxID=158149 RepID=A0A9W7X923_9POAL|nr:hypothetical protein BS78_K101300 [Paspalum vaginatum]KAJ1256908.1 hypothetical protein BS78_K273300 [Paspalum vaginatum]